MSKKDNVIEVRDLTIGYGDKTVQENLNFEVERGEIFIILGGSGCGKSTLLKHIIGLYAPFSGDIIIEGRSIVKAKGERKRNIMRNFGVLYQSGALFGSLTLAENVALPLEEYTDYSKSERDQVIDEKLALVGLDGFRDYLPSEISGGMKKRAGLARAMALDTKLLFFDEPSAGLDPISSAQLDRLILDLRDKLSTTMVIVTHELDSIFTVADRVIMLDKKTKSIIAKGDPRKLRDESDNEWVNEFLNRDGLKQ
jgi:phospholipid/cholesterol/gamma-HCH transport system ATP-binding protein